jgi:hypothetical protein
VVATVLCNATAMLLQITLQAWAVRRLLFDNEGSDDAESSVPTATTTDDSDTLITSAQGSDADVGQPLLVMCPAPADVCDGVLLDAMEEEL